MKLSLKPVKKSALLFAVFTIGIHLQAQVVISQVYGGGGNSGASLKNDFVELFNAGTSSVAIDGWSVQYASAAGVSWQTTSLTGVLAPGQYYLVQESAGTGGSQSLPAPDASGSIAMSATAAKVALSRSTSALTGTCPTADSAVADFVGYGSGVNCSKVASAPAPGNAIADIRKTNGCTNNGNNSTDFAAGAPLPRNSASPLNPCSSGGGVTIEPTALAAATVGVQYSAQITAEGGVAPYTFSLSGGALPSGLTLSSAGLLSGSPASATGSPFSLTIAAVDATGKQGTATLSLTVNGIGSCSPTATIAQVQGAGNTSPLNGTTVTIQGVVTGLTGSGFFLQMPSPGDGDPNTSDGVYVFTSASRLPSVARVGNSLCVTGTVNEYAPTTDPNSPTDTEIDNSTSTLLSSGNPLPAPVQLTSADTDPAGSVYQLEKYEGMRVQILSLTTVAPTDGSVNEVNATATSNGLFYGVISGIPRPFREPGIQQPDPLPAGSPCCVTRWDANPEVLGIDSSRLAAPLNVTSGVTVVNLTGVLYYTNRAYFLVADPDSGAAATTPNSTYTAVPPAKDSELTVAAFNMEHFYNSTGADPGTTHAVLTASAYSNRLNKASLAIRNVLRTPDILAVEELQNLQTIQDLAAKVNSDASAAGQTNPGYQAYLSLGNDISGINSGFLVKSGRVSVAAVTQYGKDSTYRTPSGSNATLNDRPPLVLQATVKSAASDSGLPIIVIVNHLRSLLSLDDPSSGPTVRAKREAQAEFLANLIQGFQAADPTANIVSVGDHNAYQFSDGFVDTVGAITGNPAPADTVVLASPHLLNPTLTNLVDTSLLPPAEKYSYSFQGSAQAIDHIVVNGNMLQRATRLAFGRLDADFPESYRGDANRPERISDHDPIEAYFALPQEITSQVNIANSGFIYSRVTRTYVGTITVTNQLTTSADGPLYLKLKGLPAGVALANAGANGLLTLSNSGLAPGQSASVTVQFSNPSNLPIQYSAAVFAGSF